MCTVCETDKVVEVHFNEVYKTSYIKFKTIVIGFILTILIEIQTILLEIVIPKSLIFSNPISVDC